MKVIFDEIDRTCVELLDGKLVITQYCPVDNVFSVVTIPKRYAIAFLDEARKVLGAGNA